MKRNVYFAFLLCFWGLTLSAQNAQGLFQDNESLQIHKDSVKTHVFFLEPGVSLRFLPTEEALSLRGSRIGIQGRHDLLSQMIQIRYGTHWGNVRPDLQRDAQHTLMDILDPLRTQWGITAGVSHVFSENALTEGLRLGLNLDGFYSLAKVKPTPDSEDFRLGTFNFTGGLEAFFPKLSFISLFGKYHAWWVASGKAPLQEFYTSYTVDSAQVATLKKQYAFWDFGLRFQKRLPSFGRSRAQVRAEISFMTLPNGLAAVSQSSDKIIPRTEIGVQLPIAFVSQKTTVTAPPTKKTLTKEIKRFDLLLQRSNFLMESLPLEPYQKELEGLVSYLNELEKDTRFIQYHSEREEKWREKLEEMEEDLYRKISRLKKSKEDLLKEIAVQKERVEKAGTRFEKSIKDYENQMKETPAAPVAQKGLKQEIKMLEVQKLAKADSLKEINQKIYKILNKRRKLPSATKKLKLYQLREDSSQIESRIAKLNARIQVNSSKLKKEDTQKKKNKEERATALQLKKNEALTKKNVEARTLSSLQASLNKKNETLDELEDQLEAVLEEMYSEFGGDRFAFDNRIKKLAAYKGRNLPAIIEDIHEISQRLSAQVRQLRFSQKHIKNQHALILEKIELEDSVIIEGRKKALYKADLIILEKLNQIEHSMSQPMNDLRRLITQEVFPSANKIARRFDDPWPLIDQNEILKSQIQNLGELLTGKKGAGDSWSDFDQKVKVFQRKMERALKLDY